MEDIFISLVFLSVWLSYQLLWTSRSSKIIPTASEKAKYKYSIRLYTSTIKV